MQKNIKYIGFHHCYSKKNKCIYSLSGVNKMEYVAKVLSEDLNFKVHLISPSWFNYFSVYPNHVNRYYAKIKFPKSLLFKGKFFNYINIVFSLVWITFYLLLHTKKNEKIIVYHSPWLYFPLFIVKKVKDIKIILEVEEIYQNVWSIPNFLKKQEYSLFEIASFYILVNDQLKLKLPLKPSVVLYGAYWDFTNEINKSIAKKDKIKIVYAGIIDFNDNAAFKAIKLSQYLDSNYEIHILGYGNIEAIISLESMIKGINESLNRYTVFYHGLLSGEKLNRFLQTCDIGLNVQNTGDYMNTAFPSKIFTYLSNGLTVVSTKISSISNSQISDYVTFTDDDTENSIATKILELKEKKSNFNYSTIIKMLHSTFVEDLKNIINNE